MDWLLIAILMAAFLAQRYYVLSSDPLLAWPITDSIAHPERYSPHDLLVQAGASGNFLLYRLLAAFPFLRDNFPLRDFLLFLPVLLLLMMAWWKVFLQLGATRAVSALSLALVLFSDDKLALNWAHVVPAYFISSSSVQFAQVLGLLWFLQRRRFLALGVTAATAYFHPATALSFGAVYAVILGIEARRARDWRLLLPGLLFAAVFLPAALQIALNSQGAFAASEEYFLAFERYQPQAYLGDHFRMGYAYTLAVVAFLHSWLRRNPGMLRQRDDVFLFIGIGLLLCAGWLANLYWTGNLQVTHTFFVMRIFTLIKPLVIYLIVAASVSLLGSAGSVQDRLIVLLFFLTPLEFSPAVSVIIVLSCAAYAAGKAWWPVLFGLLIALFVGVVMLQHEVTPRQALGFIRNFGRGRTGNELNLLQGALLIASLAFVWIVQWPAARQIALRGWTRWMFAGVLAAYVAYHTYGATRARFKYKDFQLPAVFNFDAQDYWGIRTRDPAYAELLDWARGSPYRLFTVPPYDDRFLSFRYLSGKGVYVFHRDIAQLMYSPSFYLAGIERLVAVGGESPELPKAFMSGEVARSNGTYELQCRRLLDLDRVDAVVLEKRRIPAGACAGLSPVFSNAAYLVFRAAGPRASLN